MGTPIGELMVRSVVRISAADAVGEVRDKMSSLEIGALPVVDEEGTLIGIVTSADLVPSYPASLPISRVMTHPVDSLPPEADIVEAARLMREKRRHHIVVTRGEKVVGILSAYDLLQVIEKLAGS